MTKVKLIIIFIIVVLLVFIEVIIGNLLIADKNKIAALETKQSQYQELKRIDDQIIAKANTGFGVSSQVLDACMRFELKGIEDGLGKMNAVTADMEGKIVERKNALKELGYGE